MMIDLQEIQNKISGIVAYGVENGWKIEGITISEPYTNSLPEYESIGSGSIVTAIYPQYRKVRVELLMEAKEQ